MKSACLDLRSINTLDKKEQRIKQLEGKLQAALAAQGDRDLQSCLADLRAAQGMTTGAAD